MEFNIEFRMLENSNNSRILHFILINYNNVQILEFKNLQNSSAHRNSWPSEFQLQLHNSVIPGILQNSKFRFDQFRNQAEEAPDPGRGAPETEEFEFIYQNNLQQVRIN
jgi:hypothetical protein